MMLSILSSVATGAAALAGGAASYAGTAAYAWATTPAPTKTQEFTSLLLNKDRQALSLFFHWLQMQHPLDKGLKEKLADIVIELQTRLKSTPENRFISFLLSITALYIKNSVAEPPDHYYSVGLAEKDLLCLIAQLLHLQAQRSETPAQLLQDIKAFLNINNQTPFDILPIDIAWYFLGKFYSEKEKWPSAERFFNLAQKRLPIAYLNGLSNAYFRLQTIHTLCNTLDQLLNRLEQVKTPLLNFLAERKNSREKEVFEGFCYTLFFQIQEKFPTDTLVSFEQTSVKIFGVPVEKMKKNSTVDLHQHLSPEAKKVFSELKKFPDTVNQINKALTTLEDYFSAVSIVLETVVDALGPIPKPHYLDFLFISKYLAAYGTKTSPSDFSFTKSTLDFFLALGSLRGFAATFSLEDIMRDFDQTLAPVLPTNILSLSVTLASVEQTLPAYKQTFSELEAFFNELITTIYNIVEKMLQNPASSFSSTVPALTDTSVQMSTFVAFPDAQENTFPIELVQFVEKKLLYYAATPKYTLSSKLPLSLPRFTNYLNSSKGQEQLQQWVTLCHRMSFELEETPVVNGLLAVLMQRENRIYAAGRGYEQDLENKTNQLYKSIIDFLLDHYSKVDISTLHKALAQTLIKFRAMREKHEYDLLADANDARRMGTRYPKEETDLFFEDCDSDSGSDCDGELNGPDTKPRSRSIQP